MRRAYLLLALLPLAACEGSFVRPEDYGRKVQIEKSYQARETCLKSHATDGTAGEDPTQLAHAAALACQGETEKYIAAANTDGDVKVTAQIREDTEFRAMKYVMKARGLASFQSSTN
jgi:hypothetical protein